MVAAAVLGGAILLLMLGALLAAGETVLLRLSRVRALRLAGDDVDNAGPLLWLVEHRGSAMNVVLVVTVVSRTLLAAIVTVTAVDLLGTVPGVAVGVSAAVLAIVLIGEVVPRTLTLRQLERVGLATAPALRLLVALVGPAATLLVRIGRTLAGTRSDVSGPFPEEDELRRLVEAAEDEDDPLEPDEREMVRNVFELGDTVAREIMVPRPDMITVSEDASLRELVNTILRNGHSRIPVHRDSRDQIVGVVYAKDVLRQLALKPGNDTWDTLVRPPTFAPESKRVDDLLRELQEQTVHLAIVIDEYGAVSGLVTIEDILEEIVGEIVDEHDHELPMVVERPDGAFDVDARLSVDDLNQLLDTVLPHSDWDTVAGLVFTTLGYVPTVGERVEVEGVTFDVARVQGRRIAQVVVTPPSSEPVDQVTV